MAAGDGEDRIRKHRVENNEKGDRMMRITKEELAGMEPVCKSQSLRNGDTSG